MAKRRKASQIAYTVGYKRPPKSTQFKPGQSGNPKGRPKGRRPIGAILQEIMQKRMSVTENGKTKRLSTLEIMLRRLTNDAIRSDHKAIKLLVDLLDRYGDAPEASLQVNELLAEDAEILQQYLKLPGSTPSSRSSRTTKRTRRTNVA